jgi:hypothetical protein
MLRVDLGDYALLFQPLYDELAGLPPVALAIWRALDGRRTVSEVAALVQAQLDGAPENLAEDIATLLSGLKRRGFVFTEAERPGDAGGQAARPSSHPSIALSSDPPVVLALADGSRFLIRAGDELAARVVTRFAAAASLPCASEPQPDSVDILVVTESPALPQNAIEHGSMCVIQAPGRELDRPPGPGRGAGQPIQPLGETEWLWQQLTRLSAFIGKEVQKRGGVLLHGALALAPSSDFKNRQNFGIILAGHSGVGKTTASNRLPPPWRSLCDDTTLIVRNGAGVWAHPWPTWSRIIGRGIDDCWDVQAGVPLQAIFVIGQAAQDRAVPVDGSQAVGLLLELARQASRRLWVGATPDEFRAFHAQRFENLCALVRTIPTYLLDVSLDGAFWEEIERML